MKTRRQWIGSVIALAILATFVSMGASSAHARATKKGWWIRVNPSKTEASAILFDIGTSDKERRPWRRWQLPRPTEFDVPAEFLHVAQLYIHGISEPKKKHAWFCVFYKDHAVRHFKFDGDEDHEMRQSDTDDECN